MSQGMEGNEDGEKGNEGKERTARRTYIPRCFLGGGVRPAMFRMSSPSNKGESIRTRSRLLKGTMLREFCGKTLPSEEVDEESWLERSKPGQDRKGKERRIEGHEPKMHTKDSFIHKRIYACIDCG